jgi:hypothetical protein
MSDVIYNYPKSSCTCYECEQKNTKASTGLPTNLSVTDCTFSDVYDCNNRRNFKMHQEPNTKSGNILLNKSVIGKEKRDQTFNAINVKDCPMSACLGTTYLSSDPRLYNSAGVSWLQLDKPPLNSSVKLNTLNSDKSLNRYGQGYKSYADVNAGQYLYYTVNDLEDTLFKPLFSRNATVVGNMYKDPMGSMKPEYTRIPHEKQDHAILTDPCDVTGGYSLSYIKDTQAHREDLLSYQMRKRNQERYTPRWRNNNN